MMKAIDEICNNLIGKEKSHMSKTWLRPGLVSWPRLKTELS